MKNKSGCFIAVILTIFGLALLYAGFTKRKNNLDFVENGVKSEAVLYDINEQLKVDEDTRERSILYSGRYMYLVGKDSIFIDSDDISYGDKSQIPKSLTVYYDKDMPERALLGGKFYVYGLPVLLMIVGALLLLFAVIAMLPSKKRKDNGSADKSLNPNES